MSSQQQFPLSLIVRAVDKASGPIRAMTAKINAETGPLRGLGKDFGALGSALNIDGFKQVGGEIMNVGSTAFGLAARLAGVALAAGLAFGVIIKGAMDAGDALAEHADRVGLGIDAYASYRFAAEQADVPQEMFAASLDKLNKQMGDMKAGKGGEFLHFLNEVGPGLAAQMKGAKTAEQGLAFLTTAFERIDDPQRRATLAAHAFGKSNMQMGEWLHQGSAAIQEQQREFLRLFGSQEKSARAAGELDNATRKTETAFLGLRMAAAGALFPALIKVSNAVTEFMVKHHDGISAWADKAGLAISNWVDSGGFDRLIGFLGQVADGAGRVIDFLGPMGVAIVAGAIFLAPLIAAVGSLGVAFVGVAPLLIAFAPALIAVGGAAGGLITAGKLVYDAWGGLEARFQSIGDTMRWAVVDGWKEVRPILSAMSVIPGFGGVIAAGDFVSGQVSQAIEARTGQSVAAIEARAATAEQARPGGGSSVSESRVQVEFSNLPPGVRVSQDQSSSVDLSLGYSVQPT